MASEIKQVKREKESGIRLPPRFRFTCAAYTRRVLGHARCVTQWIQSRLIPQIRTSNTDPLRRAQSLQRGMTQHASRGTCFPLEKFNLLSKWQRSFTRDLTSETIQLFSNVIVLVWKSQEIKRDKLLSILWILMLFDNEDDWLLDAKILLRSFTEAKFYFFENFDNKRLTL